MPVYLGYLLYVIISEGGDVPMTAILMLAAYVTVGYPDSTVAKLTVQQYLRPSSYRLHPARRIRDGRMAGHLHLCHPAFQLHHPNLFFLENGGVPYVSKGAYAHGLSITGRFLMG